MNSKLPLICSIAIILLSLCGCSSQVSVKASCDEFMEQQHISREVRVPANGSLTLTLCSNPTTGFEWGPAKISDQAVLEEIDHEFIGPESTPPPPPGTPGQELWTFKALKKGESTISIEYRWPWEGDAKATWTFTMTVIAK